MMNNKIKELAEQAGYTPDMFGVGHWDMPECKKFAELIIEECIEQGDTLAKHYIDTHPEQEQVMLLASIADYSNEIKKHFGVE
jgi:hypothetical protein